MATTSYKSYVPTPNPLVPTGNQAPFNNENLNPIGSHYADGTNNYAETMLIQRAIVREIFDATPQKYKLLRLFFDKPVDYQPLDEFSYLEKTFGRTALKAASGVGAPGTDTVQSVVLTTTENINVNKIIVYPDGTHGVVTSVTPGTDTITVMPMTGGALPAVVANDYFAIQGGLIADGMNFFTHYDRMTTVERYNYIMLMQRDKRWTRMEMTKYRNSSTTNYFDLDKKEQADFLYQDMFVSFLNGALGEFDITGGYHAKSMAGVYPSMVAAGCQHADSTPATLLSDFETLAFATDYKSEGATRFILGTPQSLYNFDKLWKEPGIQYVPNDRIADLNLTQYKLGDMNFVKVPMQVFQEKSMFPESWANKIICLDMDTIQPVCMQGYLPIEMGETMNKQQGTREDYKEWWMQACLSLKFNNPLSSFYMDLSGM
jgi:hypothetical protein